MICPYTELEVTDAGDGVKMCDSCICWGWSGNEQVETTVP